MLRLGIVLTRILQFGADELSALECHPSDVVLCYGEVGHICSFAVHEVDASDAADALGGASAVPRWEHPTEGKGLCWARAIQWVS